MDRDVDKGKFGPRVRVGLVCCMVVVWRGVSQCGTGLACWRSGSEWEGENIGVQGKRFECLA